MNYHLEQSKATKDERDQDIDGLVLDGLNSLTGSQPLSLESTDMSAFEGQNPVSIAGKERPGQDNNGQPASKPSDKDLLPEYLKAVKTAAGSPDNTGAKLLSAVGTYVDAINKSPANKYYGGDHQKVVDQLKEVVGIAEKAYGAKDERLLPILQKVASACVSNPQLPSPVKSKYAIGVFEKILSMQTETAERGKTLTSLSREYYIGNDKNLAQSTLDKMLKESEISYGKDDERMIPALSQASFMYYAMSNHPESIKLLERVRDLQSRPESKESPEKRTDTLLRLAELHRYSSQTASKAFERLEEAIALGEKSYAKNDPRYQSLLENAATRSRYAGLNEHSAALYEKIYDLQTSQNQSVEKRLKTLQAISTEYFEGGDYEKGARAYRQIIELAKKEFANDDKAFSAALDLSGSMHFFARRPSSTIDKTKDNLAAETKLTSGLHGFGKVLIEAGNALAARGKHNLALENYEAALESFQGCLNRGVDFNSDQMASMLSIGEVEIKHEAIPEKETDEQRHNRDRQREKREEFNRDLERFYRESAELVSKETDNKSPHLLAALDKISAFYKRPDEFRSDRSKEALPILTQALALAKSLNEPMEKIGERTVALSVAQANTGDGITNIAGKTAAIKTCSDLLHEALKASGGKSKTALLALRYLSQHSANGSWNVKGDERKGYFEEGLKFKKREVIMAKALRLPDADIAKVIDEQAQIELQLEDKESALVNMERALKLDSNLPRSREFTERLAKIYGEKGQLDQMQDLLHRSIAALDENGLSVRPVSSCVEFAQLATKQGKPEKMKDAAQMLEEVNEAIQAREAKGAYIEVLNALNQQAVSTLAWLAPYYEEQKDLVKAERTYMRYENRAHMNDEEGRSHRMAALAGLVRIYTTQGKKAEAKQTKDELDFLSRLRQ